MEYDFSIKYRRGSSLVVPDALSRMHSGKLGSEGKEQGCDEEGCDEVGKGEGKELCSQGVEEAGGCKKKKADGERGKKSREGKWKKHVSSSGGVRYWTFDTGERVRIAEEAEREELIKKIDEELGDRGGSAVY